nr:GA20-oxidase 2 [Ipomoea batatas]GMD77635.1 gibberellin 20 oxidase 2-like [Ipomoea batatas]
MDSQTRPSTSPQHQNNLSIPKQFVWPDEHLARAHEELNEPAIDLGSYFGADPEAARSAIELVRAACLSHGFFQVLNHGVDVELISAAQDCAVAFFKLPGGEKMKGEKKRGGMWGYSNAHAERFPSRLPWKETLTFGLNERCGDAPLTVDEFFKSSFGQSYEHVGLVFQKYCEAMKKLSIVIIEILGKSLGVDPSYYKGYFEEGCSSIMRCNFYPSCQDPTLTLGTGPHCDPNSITILHQDQVGGLQVFVDNKWKFVRPRNGAFVVNIGDTFQVLSNGIYKSCVHRAVVNKEHDRLSLAFFLCPTEDKPIRAPSDLMSKEQPRMYPEFTWSDLLHFTQHHYRADDATLQNFCNWFLSSNNSP